jgi:hypothetical protein
MKKSLITKEYLLTNYTNGIKTVREMSMELECNHCTIFRALKRFNIPTRPKKEISKEQLEKLYIEQKYTIAKIAKDFNFSETHVNNLIQKHKIETRKYSYLYSQNDEFFTTPNIQNCYWAGFIAADGCIGNCRNRLFLAINLKSTDECLLKEMASQTDFTGRVTQGKHKGYGKYSENTYYYSSLQIRNCQKWIESLNKNWNITEKKSLTLLPPNIADLKQQLSYIIGLIDGDGYIGISNSNMMFQLIGTKEIVIWASNVLYNLEDPNKYSPMQAYKKKNQKCYYINCSWTRAYNLLKQLEQVSTPYRLARKWDKIKEYESIQ